MIKQQWGPEPGGGRLPPLYPAPERGEREEGDQAADDPAGHDAGQLAEGNQPGVALARLAPVLDQPGDGIGDAGDLPRELDDMLAEDRDSVRDRAHGGRALGVLARLRRLLGLERGLEVGDEALALLRRFEVLD